MYMQEDRAYLKMSDTPVSIQTLLVITDSKNADQSSSFDTPQLWVAAFDLSQYDSLEDAYDYLNTQSDAFRLLSSQYHTRLYDLSDDPLTGIHLILEWWCVLWYGYCTMMEI